MRPREQRAGFTLIELMVASAIAIIVIAGVCMVFISETRQYQNESGRREAQSSGRSGVSYMETVLRNAGYGVDPDRTVLAYDSFDVTDPTSTTATDFPDAITVHERDPDFARPITSLTSNTLTLGGAALPPLHMGQILLLLNANATVFEYVTIASDPVGSVITLDPAPGSAESPIGMPGPRFHEQGSNADSIFTGGTAVKVDRYSFYVAAFPDDPSNTNSPKTPYLMLHRGVDLTGDGSVDTSDATPIAPGVEQMQIAYVLNNLCSQNNGAPAVIAPIVLGVNNAHEPPAGDDWYNANVPPAASGSPPLPWWATRAYDDLTRCDNKPANIRQIRVSLVVRGRRDPAATGDDLLTGPTGAALSDGSLPWRQLENLGGSAVAPFVPQGGGYERAVVRLSVSPRNMMIRSQFMPPAQGGG